jgi:F-type H+-transporting ATPase subunit epsilon
VSFGAVRGAPCRRPIGLSFFKHRFMQLEILTPEKKIYSGDVYGVQLPGVTGLFEILDRHAPLVSALKIGRIKVLKDKQTSLTSFDIQGGFVEVLNNQVTVLAEGAEEK